MRQRDWTVLLVGGASATGKSTLAQSLAAHYGAEYLQADLFYLALRRVMPSESAPRGLLLQPESYWAQAIDLLIENYVQVSALVCEALEPVVTRYCRTQQRCVIEGTWLLPEFGAQETHDGIETSGTVRAIFLHEPDAAELVRRRLARADPWTRQFAPDVLENIRRMRHAYGEILCTRADAVGLPVLESRPFETLFDRALAAIEAPRA